MEAATAATRGESVADSSKAVGQHDLVGVRTGNLRTNRALDAASQAIRRSVLKDGHWALTILGVVLKEQRREGKLSRTAVAQPRAWRHPVVSRGKRFWKRHGSI